MKAIMNINRCELICVLAKRKSCSYIILNIAAIA